MWCSITKKSSRKNSSESKKTEFFQSTLLKWFKENGRVYPWRQEKDPYRILIAEVMLQRTRVDQVFPVYLAFINRFPDLKSLSKARVEEIARYVKKLGLLWRAKLLSEMAKTISNDYRGEIPENRKDLLHIPGIGDYIADAMISFAFGRKRTVIDSNVIRLVSRFFGIDVKGEMRRKRKFVDFCQALADNLRNDDVRRLNWAIIDHSAAICRPEPCCVKCPLSSACHYFNERGLITTKQ